MHKILITYSGFFIAILIGIITFLQNQKLKKNNKELEQLKAGFQKQITLYEKQLIAAQKTLTIIYKLKNLSNETIQFLEKIRLNKKNHIISNNTHKPLYKEIDSFLLKYENLAKEYSEVRNNSRLFYQPHIAKLLHELTPLILSFGNNLYKFNKSDGNYYEGGSLIEILGSINERLNILFDIFINETQQELQIIR